MILGKVCKRGCGFCSVDALGTLESVKSDEAREVAGAAKELRLKHVVVTSVTRDDLVDGGAGHFAGTIRAIRELNADSIVEVLTPDFQGDKSALSTVAKARPDIFNHNVETVERLYGIVRPGGDYRRSLEVLSFMKTRGLTTKSGFMVGFGESKDEVRVLLEDLFNAGCDAVTIGQYLQPTRMKLDVTEYVRPEVFKEYGETAKAIGFEYVYSGPFVRSSYNAEGLFTKG
jgi:lipoic acid synthetase